MTREEVDLAVEWAANEGWNPGIYDADSFYNTDTKGFFIGLLNNEPIACFSAVAYNDKFGFLGFYIVKPEYRGKGYGIQIWKAGLNHLKTQNIGLDGVVAQQDNYKKSGFKLAYRNIRYEGISQGNKFNFPEIVNLSDILFEILTSYDDNLFPTSRHQFLKYWINQPESLALGILENKILRGYGMIRRCRKGYKIGPLFADNKNIAEKIFQSLFSFVPKTEIFYLDTPNVNPEAVNLAKKYNMKYVFETARMYTKSLPKIPLSNIFGVTTFELG